MNLALTVVGVVLGLLQVKSEVEGIEQQDLAPVMEMAKWLESSRVLDGVDDMAAGAGSGGLQIPGN
jgi:hypothetical protein